MSKRVPLSQRVPFFGGYEKNYKVDNDRYYMLPLMQIRDSNVFSSGLGNNHPWFNQRGQKLFNIGKPSVMKKVASDFRDLFSQINIARNIGRSRF